MRLELQEALNLYYKSSGWELNDGKLTNKNSGKYLNLKYLLVSPAFERIVLPFKDNLQKT